MKRTNKKGFTIVELVIVIAVIAILAAVLIPNISKLVQKANASADESLVRNLNTALSMDVEKHTTMSAALKAAKDNGGYDLETIELKGKGNKILWDSVNDCFVYLKGTDRVYLPNTQSVKKASEMKDYEYFEIVKEVPAAAEQKYSIYLAGDTNTDAVEVSVGFDAGANKISKVTFNSEKNISVLINTNGGEMKVNAENASVNHRGEATVVTIDAVALNSYHEYGVATVISVAKGHIKIEKSGSVSLINVTATAANDFSITSNQGGILGAVKAANVGVLVSNGENKNIDVDEKTGVMSEENKDAVAFSVKRGFISSLSELFEEDCEVTLLKSIVLNSDLQFNTGKSVKIDLAGNKIEGENKQITIGNGSSLTLINGEIVLNEAKSNTSAIVINKASSIVLENTVFKSTGVPLYPRGDAALVSVNKSTLDAGVYAVTTNAKDAENFNVRVELKNSSFKGLSPILFNVPGTYIIDNCDVVGSMHGVVIRGGTATITNCRISQSDNDESMYKYFENKNWGSGNTIQLGGLIVGNKGDGYPYPSIVTVENTTIKVGSATFSDGTIHYFPAIFVNGNTTAGNGVQLVTKNVTFEHGEMVVGNEYCIVNGKNYSQEN